jgi:uncharacterized protein YqeY
MSLKERITQEMKDALRARDEGRLRAIRLLQAAVQRQEIDQRTQLDDVAVIAQVERLIKQSREALEQFERAGRADLIAREKADIAVWQAYLPEALSEHELDLLVAQAVGEVGASSLKDMGKVMGILKPKVQGRADMGQVSAKVKARLGAN